MSLILVILLNIRIMEGIKRLINQTEVWCGIGIGRSGLPSTSCYDSSSLARAALCPSTVFIAVLEFAVIKTSC